MSTPEQPATPALTRKQLRDIRNTGATPVVSGDGPLKDQPPAVDPATETTDSPVSEDGVDKSDATPTPAVNAAPLPRAAQPVAVHDLPAADASIDLGIAPLTRRQARQQELIRTASVPVITPEVAAAHAAATAEAAARADDDAETSGADEEARDAGAALLAPAAGPEHADDGDQEPSKPDDESSASAEGSDDESERAIVNPRFGSDLLAGEAARIDLPPSFDQLIARSATGVIGTGNALILSQTPSAPTLAAPVTATGEVLITGSFDLPEGLGSTGHALGTADGKETDAVLVDGELPAHSSPTPISASAAISTVKNGGDIIKPPTPEKGGRLMLTLAITAGVLALALVGVLILAFVTGVF